MSNRAALGVSPGARTAGGDRMLPASGLIALNESVLGPKETSVGGLLSPPRRPLAWMRIRLGSRRSGITVASRRHMPSLHSATRSSSRPASEDWLPPSKSTVSFLRRTAGRSKGSGVSVFMMAVAARRCTRRSSGQRLPM